MKVRSNGNEIEYELVSGSKYSQEHQIHLKEEVGSEGFEIEILGTD